MRIRVDERFLDEARALDLRYRCPDCVYFVAADRSCAHEWPNEVHLRPPTDASGELDFCKEFETA